MIFFVIKRLVGIVAILFAMSILIFAILYILPGNAAYVMLGEFATPEAVAILEQKLGLNDPVLVQYWRWLSRTLQGDFGESISTGLPVTEMIAGALGRSAILAALSFILVALLGIVLGVYSAIYNESILDRISTLIQFLFIAVPDFFWAIIAIIVFSSWLNWFPATGYTPMAETSFWGWLSHLVLPVLVLTAVLLAHISRMTRSSMLEVLESRYVLAARAKGLPEPVVIRRHALRNALLPTITILAIDVGVLFGGIVVIETIFAYPGLGRVLIYAIQRHDLPLLQAGVMIVTAIYATANLLADLGYAYLDPRIRYSKATA